MDPKQVEQRNFLQNLASQRKGAGAPKEEEKKQGFAISSVTSFRNRMLEEEK